LPVDPAPDGRAPIVHYFFPLPEPLNFPDGYTPPTEHVGDTPDEPTTGRTPWALLTYYRRSVPGDPALAGLDAAHQVQLHVVPGATASTEAALDSADAAGPTTTVTVLHARTPLVASSSAPPNWQGRVQEVPPSGDPFNRCLRLAQDHVRALRLANRTPYAFPTYEQLPFMVPYFTQHPANADGADRWVGPSVMLLDHANVPGAIAGPDFTSETDARFGRHMAELRRGFPLMAYQERVLDGRRALDREGDYAGAVVLFQTASEVLLDKVLVLLLWEEKVLPATAAVAFKEGEVGKRMQSSLAPRLKGQWSLTEPGPVADWYSRCARLRNRVVHGGYRPTRGEADNAYQALHGLEQHVMDRLVDQRTTYPRSTLMTVAESGLRRRGRWSGQIKKFHDEVAPTEPNWVDDVRAWNVQFIAVLT